MKRQQRSRVDSHINWEFAAEPFQLGGVGNQSTDAADMGFLDVDGFGSQTIQESEIICEHIRTLVIFGRDILGDGFGERHGVCAPKRQLEDIAGKTVSWLQVSFELSCHTHEVMISASNCAGSRIAWIIDSIW
jgi:hypothetical protein